MQKIAIPSEDGERISNHFGRAPFFQVFTLENGKITAQEQRDKPYHQHHAHDGQPHRHHGSQMFAVIADCQVLICGGMGTPAYQKAQAASLEVVLTGGAIQPALQAYLRGELVSDLRRVHTH